LIAPLIFANHRCGSATFRMNVTGGLGKASDGRDRFAVELDHDVAGGRRARVVDAMRLARGVEDRPAGADALAERFDFALEHDDRDVVRVGMRRVARAGRQHRRVRVQLAQAPVGPSNSFFVRTFVTPRRRRFGERREPVEVSERSAPCRLRGTHPCPT
jgi:hypothetical protein